MKTLKETVIHEFAKIKSASFSVTAMASAPSLMIPVGVPVVEVFKISVETLSVPEEMTKEPYFTSITASWVRSSGNRGYRVYHSKDKYGTVYVTIAAW